MGRAAEAEPVKLERLNVNIFLVKPSGARVTVEAPYSTHPVVLSCSCDVWRVRRGHCPDAQFTEGVLRAQRAQRQRRAQAARAEAVS